MGVNVKRIDVEYTVWNSFFRCRQCKADFRVEYINVTRDVEFCPCCGVPFITQPRKRQKDDFDE